MKLTDSRHPTTELNSLLKGEELWTNQGCKNTGSRLDECACAKARGNQHR